MILASRFDIGADYIATLSPADTWSIIRARRLQKAADQGLQICFRGFKMTSKQRLSDIAMRRKLRPVRFIDGNVDFLCVGKMPCREMLDRAFGLGVQLLSESQFYDMIQTGEARQASTFIEG